MPTIVERVDNPSEQDIIDLQKIYKDYPQAIEFSEITDIIASENVTFYGTRFNDRLIGALSIQLQEGVAIIDHLCVREITRKRHVARDTFRQILEIYEGSLKLTPCENSEALQALMKQNGFVYEADSYYLHR